VAARRAADAAGEAALAAEEAADAVTADAAEAAQTDAPATTEPAAPPVDLSTDTPAQEMSYSPELAGLSEEQVAELV
jgi:hypothetical protein